MPFCWLCTHSEANCVFTPLGSERSAAPADSVIPGLRVCRHVSAATEFSTSLTSLHSGRQVQGLTRGLWHNFLPHLFQFVQDAATTPSGQRPLERGCISIEMVKGQVPVTSEENKYIYSYKPLRDLCSTRRLFYNLSVLCVLNIKIRVQPSCVWNDKIFLEQVLQNQGCGHIILVKYQLMACESCFLFVLMFIFFHSGALKNSVTACEFTFFLSLEHCVCFFLLTVTHGAVLPTTAEFWKHAVLLQNV